MFGTNSTPVAGFSPKVEEPLKLLPRKQAHRRYLQRRDNVLPRERARYWAKRETRLQQAKERYKANKSVLLARVQAYQEKNPDKRRAWNIKGWALRQIRQNQTDPMLIAAATKLIASWRRQPNFVC